MKKRMKKWFSIMVCLIVFNNGFAQSWGWSSTVESEKHVLNITAGHDNNGNVVSVVLCDGKVTFRGMQDTVTGDKGKNYIVKQNKNGVYQWVQPIDAHYISCVELDAEGNIYIAGVFRKDFKYQNLTKSYSNSILNYRGFILKTDTNGTAVWLKTYNTNNNVSINGLAIDNDQDELTAILRFESDLLLKDTTLNGNGGLVLNLNLSGDIVWMKSIEGTDHKSVAIDQQGNRYLTGYFDKNFGVDGFQDSLVGTGRLGMYLAKLDKDGNHQASRLFNAHQKGVGSVIRNYLAVAPDGGVVLSASYSDSLVLSDTITSSVKGIQVHYIAKFSDDLAPEWVEPIHDNGASDIYLNKLSINSLGDIYIGGRYTDSVFYQNERIGTQTSGFFTGFFMSVDAEGAKRYVVSMPSKTGYIYVQEAFPSTEGKVIVSGFYQGDFSIGDSTYQEQDMLFKSFVAQYSEDNSNSVQEKISSKELSFYPNPSNGLVRFSYPAAGLMQVYTLQGEVVLEKRYHKAVQNATIDLNHLSPQTYVLRYRTNHLSLTKSLVVVK